MLKQLNRIADNIARQINTDLENLVVYAATNTSKKYFVWTQRIEFIDESDAYKANCTIDYKLFDEDEPMKNGYMIDLNEVRKMIEYNLI